LHANVVAAASAAATMAAKRAQPVARTQIIGGRKRRHGEGASVPLPARSRGRLLASTDVGLCS
jgi:hypothetical protein